MSALFAFLPEWADYLIRGIVIFVLMSFSAVIATRAGRSPYWALLVIVPFAAVALVLAFAFTRWPAVDGGRKPTS